MSLNMLSDFIQILQSIREHYTKVKYFPMRIPFIIIYLLLDYKLNQIINLGRK
jgi:hypothetical protein